MPALIGARVMVCGVMSEIKIDQSPTRCWNDLRARFLSFTVAVLILTGIFASQLARLISFSFREGYSSHVAIAPVIVIYLFWNSREKIFKRVGSSLLWAALFASIALTGVLLGRHYATILSENDYVSLFALSFCLFVIAIFLAIFGRRAAASAVFPFAMLLFFVPLPLELAQRVILALQSASAVLVYWMFSLLHVPVLREGFVFTVPGVSIEIATECSGINSSMALLITALLVAHDTLRKTWSRVIFVLASLPLAIVKNGIRIVTLTLLATHVDMSFLTGKLHHRGGFVFFLLTLVLMVPVWKLLKRSEDGSLSKGSLASPAMAIQSFPPAS